MKYHFKEELLHWQNGVYLLELDGQLFVEVLNKKY